MPQPLAFPVEGFRARQPQPATPRPFRLPRMKPFTLRNGIKVYLVEQHELPIVSLDLNFDAGAQLDPRGKEGLASICMAMLTEGTESLDKLQYAEALGDVASNISAYAADDSVGLTMSSLTRHLDTTFGLFAQTLLAPAFRAADFDRMIKRRIEAVRQSKTAPSSVAQRVAGAVLYGAQHPLGAVVTERSLAAITVEDCRAYRTAHARPAGARLFVVGDLTEAQVRAYFERGALAGWTGRAAALAPTPPPATMPGRIFFVHVPNAAQSQVTLMHFGPSRTAPDYFANMLLAAVFGGSFSSRINMNLRERKGYSYGARGGFAYSRTHGTFSASASVRTDSTYQTVLELDREVKELWSGRAPITHDELHREKQGAILGLPGQFATAQAALGNYRRLVYFGLPLAYYDTYAANIAQVGLPQLRTAAARHLRPGQAVYVVVGDGDAAMVVRDGDKDVPYVKDGHPVTLRQALVDLAARRHVGAGGFVELDADANLRR